MKTVITKELALAEVEKWLDYKRIRASEREDKKDNIDKMVEAVCEGSFVINEDSTITMKLAFPVEGEIKTEELVFKARVQQGTIQQHLLGIKSTDLSGFINAYICALTSKPKEIIRKLDTIDFSLASSVVNFFT